VEWAKRAREGFHVMNTLSSHLLASMAMVTLPNCGTPATMTTFRTFSKGSGTVPFGTLMTLYPFASCLSNLSDTPTRVIRFGIPGIVCPDMDRAYASLYELAPALSR